MHKSKTSDFRQRLPVGATFVPQTILSLLSTLFLGYQFLNRGKEQKYACETILSI